MISQLAYTDPLVHCDHMMPQITWDEVRTRRLQRHGLLAASSDLVAVARAASGIHAQVQASAELQLAVRVVGLSRQDVRDALWEHRRLVKAWTLRGTLHLHPADELPLWFGARPGGTGADQYEDLEPAEIAAIYAAIHDALDGRCLLREELVEEVVRRVGPKPRERLSSGWAFFLDDVCQGPPQGNKVTFARPDQWLEGWREVDRTEALGEACRRYLRTYGPARPDDFRVWLGGRSFDRVEARKVFASLELEEVDVAGHRSFVLAGDTAFPDHEPSVKLLPEYDVYVMGFREREHLVPPEARARLLDHARGKYEGPAAVRWLLVDGIAGGMWERKKRTRKVELTVEPFRKLTRAQRALVDAEAERIGAFLGLEPELTVTGG